MRNLVIERLIATGYWTYLELDKMSNIELLDAYKEEIEDECYSNFPDPRT